MVVGLSILAIALCDGATSTQAEFEPAAGPVSSVGGIITDTIGEAIGDLEDAVSLLEGGGAINRPALAISLDSAERAIRKVLDPAVEPVLTPPHAGAIEPGSTPASVLDYAYRCLDLAVEASIEADSEVGDEIVGSKLKTIIHLLPGYREAAGL